MKTEIEPYTANGTSIITLFTEPTQHQRLNKTKIYETKNHYQLIALTQAAHATDRRRTNITFDLLINQ